MATWKSTPDERAQAAQLVLQRVENGETLADSVRHFARALEVSEDSLRRWMRQEKASAQTASEPETTAPAVAVAVLDRPEAAPPEVGRFDTLFAETQTATTRTKSRPWRTFTRVAAVAAAVGAALLSSGIVKSLHDSPREKAEARVADYVAGNGTHEFVAADSNFRATFPFGVPRRTTESRTVGPLTVDFISYGTETDSGAFLVGSFALPANVAYDLNGGVNGAAVAMESHIDSATPTTFQGFPAIDFVFSGSESGRPYVSKGVIVDAGTRVYVLQALWEGGAAPGYDAFKASLHIG